VSGLEPGLLEAVDIDIASVRQAIKRLRETMQKPQPGLNEAVEMSIAIENDIAEHYYRAAISQSLTKTSGALSSTWA
jgi:hypothetical protein